jgi:CBS domain-containing protein
MKTCGDIMSVNLKCVTSAATALDAARMMRSNSVGFLPVCDRQTGRLIGVVTDRDLVTRLAVSNVRPSAVPVVDVLTSEPAVCRQTDSLETAEEVMMALGISRLVIVDQDEHPIGIVSLTDIIMTESDRRAARVARRVLEREAGGPHAPMADIALAPSDPAVPGPATRAMKEFPG